MLSFDPHLICCLKISQIWSSLNVTHHAKQDLMGITKSIDRGQPAQSAQADHGRNFSLLADFLRIK